MPHRWTLEQSLSRNIQPKENTYEYINGSFRPNTKRVLELLSGPRLYDSPMAALRELLQNAFDAVQEKIAYQRLNQADPGSRELGLLLGGMNQVMLDVRTEGEAIWLDCTDTGVGMTRSILTNQFLVSGSPRTHRLLDLERRCTSRGFELGRTGEFGIGALSYFMLADRVEIETRRAQEPGDIEMHGWVFTTDGIGSFGELRRFERAPGTTVRLRLRSDVAKNGVEWARSLVEFVRENVTHLPCRLTVTENGRPLQDWPVGWLETPEMMTEGVIEVARKSPRFRSSVPAYLSQAKRERYAAQQTATEELFNRIRESMRWFVTEGDTPGGTYRVALPCFELPLGSSLFYFDLAGDGPEHEVTAQFEFEPLARHSWKGLSATPSDGYGSYGQLEHVYVTWNWTSPSAAKISIDRTKLEMFEGAEQALTAIREVTSHTVQQWVASVPASPFTSLNRAAAGLPRQQESVFWIVQRDDHLVWKQLQWPVYEVDGNKYDRQRLRTSEGEKLAAPAPFFTERHWPDRIVAITGQNGSIRSVAGTADSGIAPSDGTRFPPEWSSVAAVYGANTVVLNRSHDVGIQLQKRRAIVQFSDNPLDTVRQHQDDPILFAQWLLQSAIFNNGEQWTLVTEEDPALAERVWKKLRGAAPPENAESFDVIDIPDEEVIRLTRAGATVTSWFEETVLPRPGSEWCVIGD
ncbi:MAG TPA: hypothetical protein VGF69_08135 [Thermoanaerobaculia bacterium]|jgi:hypothetical protein